MISFAPKHIGKWIPLDIPKAMNGGRRSKLEYPFFQSLVRLVYRYASQMQLMLELLSTTSLGVPVVPPVGTRNAGSKPL